MARGMALYDGPAIRILSNGGRPVSDPASVVYARCTVDLTAGAIAFTDIPCRNLEDVLGGFGRSFQILATHDITDAFSPANPLVVNTGALTGTSVMTGLRTYFSAYSPLKKSNKGLPAAIWSAGSGKFGSKLKWAGVDEIIFEGACATARASAKALSHRRLRPRQRGTDWRALSG